MWGLIRKSADGTFARKAHFHQALLAVFGAQGRDRTTDTAIFNRMLYQLSYLGAERWYKSST